MAARELLDVQQRLRGVGLETGSADSSTRTALSDAVRE
jgi:hypothetical protein